MKIFKFLFACSSLLFLLFSLQSCYVSKPLDHDVRIAINNDFPVIIKKEGNSDFSSKHTEAEYRKAYNDELVRMLNYNHIVIDPASPEFTVHVNQLELTESTKMDTVKDEKSKDNGKIRELTLAGLKTSGTIVQAGTTTAHNWQADKDKNESVTNNRSLDQVIAGENKDNSVYREKAFDDNEFVNQSVVCGRRAAVRITNEIQRLLKK